jgi:hypothetical protein
MHRILTCVAAAAILFAAGPAFADAGGPYKMDAKGKCHDAKGAYATASKCKAGMSAMTSATGGKCRDTKTKKFVKCGAAGSEPVPAMAATSAAKPASTTAATTTTPKKK